MGQKISGNMTPPSVTEAYEKLQVSGTNYVDPIEYSSSGSPKSLNMIMFASQNQERKDRHDKIKTIKLNECGDPLDFCESQFIVERRNFGKYCENVKVFLAKREAKLQHLQDDLRRRELKIQRKEKQMRMLFPVDETSVSDHVKQCKADEDLLTKSVARDSEGSELRQRELQKDNLQNGVEDAAFWKCSYNSLQLDKSLEEEILVQEKLINSDEYIMQLLLAAADKYCAEVIQMYVAELNENKIELSEAHLAWKTESRAHELLKLQYDYLTEQSAKEVEELKHQIGILLSEQLLNKDEIRDLFEKRVDGLEEGCETQGKAFVVKNEEGVRELNYQSSKLHEEKEELFKQLKQLVTDSNNKLGLGALLVSKVKEQLKDFQEKSQHIQEDLQKLLKELHTNFESEKAQLIKNTEGLKNQLKADNSKCSTVFGVSTEKYILELMDNKLQLKGEMEEQAVKFKLKNQNLEKQKRKVARDFLYCSEPEKRSHIHVDMQKSFVKQGMELSDSEKDVHHLNDKCENQTSIIGKEMNVLLSEGKVSDVESGRSRLDEMVGIFQNMNELQRTNLTKWQQSGQIIEQKCLEERQIFVSYYHSMQQILTEVEENVIFSEVKFQKVQNPSNIVTPERLEIEVQEMNAVKQLKEYNINVSKPDVNKQKPEDYKKKEIDLYKQLENKCRDIKNTRRQILDQAIEIKHLKQLSVENIRLKKIIQKLTADQKEKERSDIREKIKMLKLSNGSLESNNSVDINLDELRVLESRLEILENEPLSTYVNGTESPHSTKQLYSKHSNPGWCNNSTFTQTDATLNVFWQIGEREKSVNTQLWWLKKTKKKLDEKEVELNRKDKLVRAEREKIENGKCRRSSVTHKNGACSHRCKKIVPASGEKIEARISVGVQTVGSDTIIHGLRQELNEMCSKEANRICDREGGWEPNRFIPVLRSVTSYYEREDLILHEKLISNQFVSTLFTTTSEHDTPNKLDRNFSIGYGRTPMEATERAVKFAYDFIKNDSQKSSL